MVDTDITDTRQAEAKEQANTARTLSIFVFLATLLGSLVGAAADLSDATGLVVPILETLSPSPRLRIAGSNTVLGDEIGLATVWGDEFQEQKAWEQRLPLIGTVDRTLNLTIDGVGSVTGFEQARQGRVNLLVMSEPLPQDRYQDLVQAGVDVSCAGVIGYDVIAFVTDVNNPVPEISQRQMAGMLSGTFTNWSEVGGPDTPVRILARRGSGTTELVLQAFTGSADFPPHFTECEDNTQCLDMALSTPGSLYWVSTAWLRTQPPRYLRLILIPHGQRLENPLLPVCGTVEEGVPCFEPDHYAPELVRPLYMYVLSGAQLNAESTGLAYEFLQYVRGVRGQAILENHNLYTHFDPPAQVQVDFPAASPLQQVGLDGLRGPCTPSQ